MLQLLERNKIVAELFGFTPDVAAEKLIAGDIDAVFIVATWDSPVVQRLITAQGIELRSFPRADAYIQLYPFLNKVVLQEGVGDLATNRPPSDVVLVAPKASLAVRADLHPAIQYLLLAAAVEIYSGPGLFRKAGQFPAAEFDRYSAKRCSTAFLQKRATVPAQLSSVLDRGASRTGACCFCPTGTRALSLLQALAASLRLDYAVKDNAPLR